MHLLRSGGFGPEITDAALFSTFSTFGDVVSINLPTDQSKRMSRMHSLDRHRAHNEAVQGMRKSHHTEDSPTLIFRQPAMR